MLEKRQKKKKKEEEIGLCHKDGGLYMEQFPWKLPFWFTRSLVLMIPGSAKGPKSKGPGALCRMYFCSVVQLHLHCHINSATGGLVGRTKTSDDSTQNQTIYNWSDPPEP